MRVLTTRLALGALVLGSVCALADSAQAGPLRRLFGRGAGYGSGYSTGYYGGGYSGGATPCCDGGTVGATYAQPAYYPQTTIAPASPCCGQSNYVYGGANFRSGYGASMYFPTQGYGYAQPMPYATGGVYQAGYPQGYASGAIPTGGLVPGQLPTRPHDGAHEGTTTDASPADAKKVKITDGSFEPADMSINVGTTVKWTNDGKKPHTVSSDKGDWGSEELANGQTFTATFTKAGTFEYHCKLHPDMKGKITVK